MIAGKLKTILSDPNDADEDKDSAGGISIKTS